jgi:hypothetical protein
VAGVALWLDWSELDQFAESRGTGASGRVTGFVTDALSSCALRVEDSGPERVRVAMRQSTDLVTIWRLTCL